jgi:hypothetical protein
MTKTGMKVTTQENVLIPVTYHFHARRIRVFNSIKRF